MCNTSEPAALITPATSRAGDCWNAKPQQGPSATRAGSLPTLELQPPPAAAAAAVPGAAAAAAAAAPPLRSRPSRCTTCLNVRLMRSPGCPLRFGTLHSSSGSSSSTTTLVRSRGNHRAGSGPAAGTQQARGGDATAGAVAGSPGHRSMHHKCVLRPQSGPGAIPHLAPLNPAAPPGVHPCIWCSWVVHSTPRCAPVYPPLDPVQPSSTPQVPTCASSAAGCCPS